MTLLIEYDVLFSMVLTIIKSEVNAEIHGVKDMQNLVFNIFDIFKGLKYSEYICMKGHISPVA